MNLLSRSQTRLTSLLFGIFACCAALQAEQPLVLIGDSIAQSVQSLDANRRTQPKSFGVIVADKMGVDLPLPLIRTSPVGTVFSDFGRVRINPATFPANLAFSGATIGDILRQRPGDPDALESNLVIPPFTGSQIEIVELLQPALVLGTAGGNDVLEAAALPNSLNLEGLTPLDEVMQNYAELAARIAAATGGRGVLANLPRITTSPLLLTPEELEDFAGSDFGLRPGFRTHFATAIGLREGILPAFLLLLPDWVLDPDEAAALDERIDTINAFIASELEAQGLLLADVASVFDELDANGAQIAGIPLTTQYLGGFTSLDGVHLSNIGQRLLAAGFITALNEGYGMSIPQVTPSELIAEVLTDPHVDKDGDGVVTGRPLAGLLETLFPLLGVSGDADDSDPSVNVTSKPGPHRVRAFVQEYRRQRPESAPDSALPLSEQYLAVMERLLGR